MSSMTSPRGPLPARVYWVRRTLALVLALLLVFAIGKVLTSFGGDDGGAPKAATMAGTNSPSATPQAGSATGAGSAAGTQTVSGRAAKTTKSSGRKAGKRTVPQSVPTGPCQPDAVTVTSTVATVDGGAESTLPLRFTSTGGACTWRVSSKTVVLKITSGTDRIWSSQDCQDSIPTTDVVVRPAGEKPAQVDVTWSGRRSEAGCVKGTAWADPGSYHVSTASLGGQPTDTQFVVAAPPRPTVTRTVHPKRTRTPKAVETPKG